MWGLLIFLFLFRIGTWGATRDLNVKSKEHFGRIARVVHVMILCLKIGCFMAS